MRKIKEIEEFKALISEGNRLKNLPESEYVLATARPSGLSIPITFQMDCWINKSIKRIYSLLPKTIIDSNFPEVVNIHKSCIAEIKIITFDRKKSIDSTINVLYACMNFLKWIAKFDENKLSPKQRGEFYFNPLETTVSYIHKELIPKLVGLEDGRTRKTALLHLYGRIFFLTNSISKLNGPRYCPSLTALLRSLLELYIDILLINETLIENDIERFFSFNDIYSLNSVSKIIKIDEEIKRPIAESSQLRKVINNKSKITQKAQELWGKDPKDIRHWTLLNLEKRARRVKQLRIYREVYYYGNMFVHSGYLHYPKTEDDAHLLSSYVYSLSLEIFVKSTKLIIDTIDIENKNGIEQELTGLHVIYGYFHIWKSSISPISEMTTTP